MRAALFGLLLVGLVAMAGATPNRAAAFSVNYCYYTVFATPCKHGNFNSIIYNRANAGTANNHCVYMKTEAGNLRGGGGVFCYPSTYQSRMCVSSPTPMSEGYSSRPFGPDGVYMESVVNNTTYDTGCAV